MSAFAAVMVGLSLLLLVVLLLLGLYHPKSGADVLGWKPTRSAELEAQNELDDLAQMLDAANARRRARGQAERTIEDVELSVSEHHREQARRRDAGRAGEEVEQMLAAKNARRARRGLPALTLEEYRAQIGLDA